MNVFALVEKTLRLPPCHIVKNIFPPDDFQLAVQDALENATYASIEYACDKILPKANWLPSLEDFTKLLKRFK